MTTSPTKLFACALLLLSACSHSTMSTSSGATPAGGSASAMGMGMATSAPSPDPRVGLRAGTLDSTHTRIITPAAEASWNLRLVSATPPSPKFVGSTNSDLAFSGNDVIQGSYDGYQVWDISNPMHPMLKVGYFCPASQSDVSVYKNLLFVSSESTTGRLDCGAGGVQGPASDARIRGVRIFDISDIASPKYIANVQTCRGSHTHTLLVDPKDPANVYVYVSGSAGVRPAAELAGCSNSSPDQDPNSAHFRIEVIKVPLAHPEQAAIVSSPRIFNDLAAPPTHGASAADAIEMAEARKKGAFIIEFSGNQMVLPNQYAKVLLDSTVKARNGTGTATKADSDALRAYLPTWVKIITGGGAGPAKPTGPDQCHDITVYPAIGLAGGACAGYGLLLDIKDPAHPVRIDAVSDSNFSYWHSATFNNDGTKLLFSDEWGGGGQPKCRALDKKEWGADAIFTLQDRKLHFQSYYKMPAVQTSLENCVAHNGSLIPIPGRDVMIQAWYQGGVSVFDWTDAAHPKEIGFFDRGPSDDQTMGPGGSWSVHWYNGVMYSSEILRGLDVFELTPSPFISQNEIDAAKSVHVDYLNVQGQPHYVWPATFSLARAYVDQLARMDGMSRSRVDATRSALNKAEQVSGSARRAMLSQLSEQLRTDGSGVSDRTKVQMLSTALSDLADRTN
jgi:hypothetical protein